MFRAPSILFVIALGCRTEPSPPTLTETPSVRKTTVVPEVPRRAVLPRRPVHLRPAIKADTGDSYTRALAGDQEALHEYLTEVEDRLTAIGADLEAAGIGQGEE